LAHVAAARGRYEDALTHLSKSSGSPVLEANIVFETTGTFIDATASTPSAQKDMHTLRARYEVEQGEWSAALRAADAAIEIVRRTGERALLPVSLRALALANLGHEAEAREALAQSPNNLYSAQACFALGLDDVGREVLLRAYPHGTHWEREHAQSLLGFAPEIEPESAERLPHEPEIVAAIEKLRNLQAERRKRFLA
jgi:hypothetical protein